MKSCVPHQTDTLLGSYLFEPTCLFDETLPRLFILPFFLTLTQQIFSSLLFISFYFVRLFCKLSSSGSSDPTTSEERDPFYPGRRLSIVLGTS